MLQHGRDCRKISPGLIGGINVPEVSVVIPSYNHAAYISEAVQSVLAQTHRDLELIVIDDGSRDNSLEILQGFTDPRLKVMPQENQGAHAAINRGFHAASGEYLAVLNSDDAFHPQRLEKLLAALKAEPDGVLAGSHIEIVDDQGKALGVKHGYLDCPPWSLEDESRSFRVGDDLHAALLTENYYATTSNFLFPHRVFEQMGYFRPLRYVHDWDFALRLSERGQLLLLPEPLIRYRMHARNMIGENQAAMIFEICWLLAVHLPAQIAGLGFGDIAPAQRADQLLHSIHVAGCERALSLLLAYRLSENTSLALRLLDPQDGVRQQVMDFIGQRLAAQPVQSNNTLADKLCRHLRQWKKR
jgi:glycosyltransferase involved in cell wall biosynthesis